MGYEIALGGIAMMMASSLPVFGLQCDMTIALALVSLINDSGSGEKSVQLLDRHNYSTN
jgi:hypothetical protein